jgi:hypothetical protein
VVKINLKTEFMEKIIACCGLNCATCDARIATLSNDNELRAQTAEKWKVLHRAVDLTANMINCTGCREEGVKFAHCNVCDIRKCADTKNLKTCALCDQLDLCETVKNLHQFVPEALINLKNLN